MSRIEMHYDGGVVRWVALPEAGLPDDHLGHIAGRKGVVQASLRREATDQPARRMARLMQGRPEVDQLLAQFLHDIKAGQRIEVSREQESPGMPGNTSKQLVARLRKSAFE